MSSNEQSSYLGSLEFFQICNCLTKVIVNLNKLVTKISFLNFPEIDKELMLSYLHIECLQQSNFCEKVIETYCTNFDFPKKNTEQELKFYLNYYLGFVLDGLYFLDYSFTMPALKQEDGKTFAVKSFEKSNEILKNIEQIINNKKGAALN